MTSLNPLITTIIPTFKRPVMLRRAISSALDQNIAALKICVYDNASNDETHNVIAEFRDKGHISYTCHQQNIGSSANFQYGLSRVDTPFFSILSDDDYLLPNFYQHALTTLQRHPEAMCWVGVTLNVDEQNIIWDARLLRWSQVGIFSPPDGFFAMTAGMAPTWTGILFRREILDRIGLLDLAALGPSDLEYCLRLAARFPYYVEKHPSAVFTLNSQSFSATQPLESFWPGWLHMIEKFKMDGELDQTFRSNAAMALQKDAVRMLFRRGANALALKRHDFTLDAASALSNDCGLKRHATILRILTHLCQRSEITQHAYTSAYRLAEQRIIRSRAALQKRYADLLCPLSVESTLRQ